MDLELEKSPVNELGGLLRGRVWDITERSHRAPKLSGPLSNLSVAGSFNLSDVHRWDMMSEHNRSWTVNYKGACGLLLAERIEVATTDSPNKLRACCFGLDEATRSGPSTWP